MLLAVGLEITEESDNQREAAGPLVSETKMWKRGGQEGEENWGDAGGLKQVKENLGFII